MSAETERHTPRRVRLSASDRTPERTHRVGERVDRILERVDRILQGSLGQGRVRRTCRPREHVQAAQCSFPQRAEPTLKDKLEPQSTGGRKRNRPPKSASRRQRKRSPASTEKHTKPQLDATPVESAQSTGSPST